ncbi:hypothetical protein GOODEAATRI_000641, partial [Goodea atripinnis]
FPPAGYPRFWKRSNPVIRHRNCVPHDEALEYPSTFRMTGREFFTRFPALYPFLLTQLEEAAATVERPALSQFPSHSLRPSLKHLQISHGTRPRLSDFLRHFQCIAPPKQTDRAML